MKVLDENIVPSIKSNVQTLINNSTEDIENLTSDMLNSAVSISGLGSTTTQADLTTAWESATSQTELINRAMIYDVNNKRTWVYFANTNTWQLAGEKNEALDLLSSYATSNTSGKVYDASYINSRLDNSLNIKLGSGASVQDDCIAIGVTSTAQTNSVEGSVAVGRGAYSRLYSVSLGNMSEARAQGSLALGTMATVNTSNGVAIGYSATCSRSAEVSIGNPSATGVPSKTRFLANVTAGELDNDAVNVKQMNDAISAGIGNIETVLAQLNTGTGV